MFVRQILYFIEYKVGKQYLISKETFDHPRTSLTIPASRRSLTSIRSLIFHPVNVIECDTSIFEWPNNIHITENQLHYFPWAFWSTESPDTSSKRCQNLQANIYWTVYISTFFRPIYERRENTVYLISSVTPPTNKS